jgi:hypothetical protein
MSILPSLRKDEFLGHSSKFTSIRKAAVLGILRFQTKDKGRKELKKK